MCSARTSVLVLAGPGDRPEGCRDAALHHADRLQLDLHWREAEAAADLAALVRTEGPRHHAVVLASGLHAGSKVLAEAVREIVGAEAAAGTADAADASGADGVDGVEGLPRVIHVDTDALEHLDVVHLSSDHVLHGRGRRVFHDALAHLVAERDRPPLRLAYGDDPTQVADLRFPDTSTGDQRAPVAVLFHGGFWLDPYERDLMGPLAVALADAGWATWNVGYRRTGRSGGGWPATVEDACAAVDRIADLTSSYPLDPDRVVLLGHSAGAQLASYAAARRHLPDEAPGRVPRPRAAGFVSLAGLLDLEHAEAQGLGGSAVAGFLGAAAEHPGRYRLASPVHHLPIGLPLLAIHGADDTFVPAEQTRSYVEVARRTGDRVVATYPKVHHLDIIATDGPVMDPLLAWLTDLDPAG